MHFKGRVKGRVKGHVKGRVKGCVKGRVKGRVKGPVQGRIKGRFKGHIKGRVGWPPFPHRVIAARTEKRMMFQFALSGWFGGSTFEMKGSVRLS